MSKRNQKLSNGALFCSLLLAGMAFLLLPHKVTQNLNSVFIEIFSPVLGIDIDLSDKIIDPSLKEGKYISKQEYDHLWAAYQNLYADLLAEHQRLEQATNFRAAMPKSGDQFVMADIIKKEQGQQLLINRGAIDGIKEGQYVFSEGAIIGTVTDLSNPWARVTLLLNNTKQIPVRIVRPGKEEYLRANMIGDGISVCKIPYVPTELDVKPGDYVYASPDASFLETPRIAGTVSNVIQDLDDPLLWDITVELSADLDNVKKVAVIIVAPQQEVGTE